MPAAPLDQLALVQVSKPHYYGQLICVVLLFAAAAYARVKSWVVE